MLEPFQDTDRTHLEVARGAGQAARTLLAAVKRAELHGGRGGDLAKKDTQNERVLGDCLWMAATSCCCIVELGGPATRPESAGTTHDFFINLISHGASAARRRDCRGGLHSSHGTLFPRTIQSTAYLALCPLWLLPLGYFFGLASFVRSLRPFVRFLSSASRRCV